MRRGKILLTLHLHQARDRALELERAVTLRIKPLGRDLGRTDKLHAMFVKLVDQGHEAHGFIALFRTKRRNVVDDDRVVLARQLDVIGSAQPGGRTDHQR